DAASPLVAGGGAVRTHCGTLVRADAGPICRFLRLFLRPSPRGALPDWRFQWQAALLVLCPPVCRDNSSLVCMSAVDAWQTGREPACLGSAPAALDLASDDAHLLLHSEVEARGLCAARNPSTRRAGRTGDSKSCGKLDWKPPQCHCQCDGCGG